MIRKFLILGLTLGGIASLLAWVYCFDSVQYLVSDDPKGPCLINNQLTGYFDGCLLYRGRIRIEGVFRPRQANSGRSNFTLGGFRLYRTIANQDLACFVQIIQQKGLVSIAAFPIGIWHLSIPLLPLGLLLLAYPIYFFAHAPVLKWSRRRQGLCIGCGLDLVLNAIGKCPECDAIRFCSKCGYNLKGNMSGVCPECGTRIEKP